MFGFCRRLARLEKKVEAMSVELDALRAAVAAELDVDAKLVAYLGQVKANLDDMSAKLSEALARPTIEPADIQAIADQLNAHSADVATHLPSA